uniref:SEC7 domain-containing protein n=1 Tax=Schizophyllum commune (strain H4-8 / FGSC 9210) TaxID=578458 RepID=D8PK97_SCHCM
MVGRFSRGNKQAAQSSDHVAAGAPPSYNDSAQSAVLVASETTTTVVTTTQTTTHFFSLPLWTRKRTTSGAPPARHSTFGGGGAPAPATEDGMIRPHTMFLHDKDLPPTPPREYTQTESVASGHEQPFAANAASTTLPPAPGSATPSDCSATASSSTAALAQAALGLGLPHVMPQASPSRPSTEINSVAFNTPPPPIPESPVQNVVRRVKSSGKMRAVSTTESDLNRRRSRGLSLNLFGNSDPSPSGKGKEKEHAPDSPRPLSRRASFWNRKKSITPADEPIPPVPVPSPSKDSSLSPQIPSLRPFSPFGIGTSPPRQGMLSHSSSSLSVGSHHRGLSRSHSERVPLRPATSAGTPTGASASSSSPRLLSPPKRRQQKRPMTADSDARYKATSAFLDSPSPMSASPPTSPVLPSTAPQSPRPRSQTNPPILHRLSMSLFPSSVPSFPNNIGSASGHGHSPANSPRPSLTRPHRKPSIEIPKPRTNEESPEVYLHRLSEVVSKAEIATVLASSASSFHVQALRAYISQFDFSDDPLDVALRKLLMDVGLPRETQQIDRVIEAFAQRYVVCNPSLFTSNDHPYILAFSLIMLHTDAFNKSNKRKMTKPDYIRNTRLPGVAPEVLDRSVIPEVPSSRTLSSLANSAGAATANNGSGSMFSGKASRVDPYYLITRNQLGHLRIDIGSIIPNRSPFLYQGTAGPWDADELHRVFAQAGMIEVGAVDPTALQRVNPFFTMAATAQPTPMIASPLGEISRSPPQERVYTLKLTKVDLLNRKEDLLEGGRKSTNRKWRSWSVMLTGSQLFFFRDASWAETLKDYAELGSNSQMLPPPGVNQPDEWVSVKDAVAVYDRSYTKHENTFRFVLPDGRHYLLQTETERELNEWIARINYASAFKTAGVRMRPMGMSGKDVQLTGVAAATSHLHDMQAASRAPEVEGADQFKATFDQVKADLAAGIFHIPDANDVKQQRARLNSMPASPGSPTFAQMEMARLPGRSQVIQSKVHEIKEKLSATTTQLEADLRFARNLGIMTPFQRSTRERLLQAAHALAKRVAMLRLEVAKLVCHREVLANDLIAESRDWYRAKALALKAATETLQSRRPDTSHSTQQHHTPTPFGISNESTQSLPVEPTSASVSPPSASRPPSSARRRPPSSICESFHSALDYSSDWPTSPVEERPMSLLSASRPSVSARHSSSNSVQSFDGPPSSVEPTFSAGPSSSVEPSPGAPSSFEGAPSPFDGRPSSYVDRPSHSPDDSQDFTHEKFYTAQETPIDEEAEEWDKTRCAKRVSLVRLPSTFNLGSRFERLQEGEVLEEGESMREETRASPG